MFWAMSVSPCSTPKTKKLDFKTIDIENIIQKDF